MSAAIEHFGPHGKGTVVAGVEWCRRDKLTPRISAHTRDYEFGYRILSIERTADGFAWNWWVELCDGLYASVSGRAGSIAQAAAAAVGVTPHWHRNPETGHKWLCYPGNNRPEYITHFDGEQANVFPDCEPNQSASWSRVHAAAGPLLDMLRADDYGRRWLGGHAASIHAAMTAAERAPQALHAACRALLTTAIRTPKPHPTTTEA